MTIIAICTTNTNQKGLQQSSLYSQKTVYTSFSEAAVFYRFNSHTMI